MLIFSIISFLSFGAIAAKSEPIPQKILAISGSTRTDSYNKKLLIEAVETAKNLGAEVTVIDLKDFFMPFYDGDLEKEGMPEGVKKFRRLIVEADGVIIASPEYNRSFSAVLKNALDWASRSEEGTFTRDAFENKLFALMSASGGKSGGKKGLAHLQDVIEDLGGTVLPVQVSVGKVHEVVNSQEGLKASSVKEPLEQEIRLLLQIK